MGATVARTDDISLAQPSVQATGGLQGEATVSEVLAAITTSVDRVER
jgi:hypothetical protein